jgi:Zn-dependent peptidase ImmA (M78 family)
MSKIAKYTFSDYRKISDSYLANAGVGSNTKLPIDVENIALKSGIKVIPFMNLKKDFDIKGMVIKKPGGFDIGIDHEHYMSEKQELYYKFTIAEELAHILIHADYFEDATDYEKSANILNSLDYEDYRRLEGQAKALGNCLLLPHFLFDDFVIDYVRKNLSTIKKEYFYDISDLSRYISAKLYKGLGLSEHVLNYAIGTRWPERLIDRILEIFGMDLIK